MAVTFESVSTSTGVTVAKPSGLVVGDLMVGIISNSTPGSITTPSGFSVLSTLTTTGQGDSMITAFSKVAESADVAASNFTFNGDRSTLYRISSGAGNSADIQSTIVNTTSTGGFTPATDDNLIIFFQTNGNNNVNSATLTSVTLSGGTNPTWTIDNNVPNGGYSYGVAHGNYPTTDAITSITGTLISNDNNIAGFVLIRDPEDATATNSLHTASPTFFEPTATSGVVASTGLHQVSPTFFESTNNVVNKPVWTEETKPSDSVWTNQPK